MKPVRYNAAPHPDFQRVLRERVAAYLATQPAGRFATPFMWFKVWFWIAAHWGLWASLALVDHSAAVTLALIAAFSLSALALAYNVSHDAVHRALSPKGWVNEALFQLTFNLLGPNAALWRLRHRIMHHNCVNIPGLDFNIEAAGALRFAPTQPWRPIHRWQHLYAPLLYLLFTIHWVFVKDFKMLGLSRIGNLENISHPRWRIASLLAWKAAHVFLMIGLPAVVLEASLGQVLLGYLFYQAIVSFQFVITFTGSHLNRRLVFVPPDERGGVPHSFFEHALRTSMDFHPRNPLVGFVLGGFNAHVAHHMFPQICSVHYPAITAIIQRTAAEYKLPYLETAMWTLYADHFRYLRDMGRAPEAPEYLLGRP